MFVLKDVRKLIPYVWSKFGEYVLLHRGLILTILNDYFLQEHSIVLPVKNEKYSHKNVNKSPSHRYSER